MMNLARRLHAALAGKAEKGAKPVQGVILDDHGEALSLDGHVMHIDADGCLNLGDVDHLFGADSKEVAALPTATLATLPKGNEQTTCTICQDDFRPDEVLTILPCKHVYHRECVEQWLQVSKKCPLCETLVG